MQSLTSPARENLLIDDSECTDECTDECNRGSCNCINNEGGGNNNENYGEEGNFDLPNEHLLEVCLVLWRLGLKINIPLQVDTTSDA